ncbi:MAG: SH3 domain-containing protein [Acidobacteria bacterium]|nr:SH3 domain-containing protein [Acidobacteriota bacterium]
MPETFKSLSVAAEVGHRRRRIIFALCALVACVFVRAGAAAAARGPQQEAAAASKARIVTATGARVRSAPSASAGEVGRLQLGVVVRELERSSGREKVGAAEDYWYRVAAPGSGGVEGWVFGGLTASFDAGRRVEIYRRLAGDRLKAEESGFSDRIELVGFLERAAPEMKRRDERGEVELLRLLALHKALAVVPIEKQSESPYQAWVKKYAPQIVYSEPAGQWFVRSELFWDLQKKYGDLPLGERIAWEASQIPLPGECEGYLPCYMYLYTVTEGRYLKLYPRGAHAGEALGQIADSLAGIVKSMSSPESPYEVPAADRAEFGRTVALLRSQLGGPPHPKRALALKHLDALARRFR